MIEHPSTINNHKKGKVPPPHLLGHGLGELPPLSPRSDCPNLAGSAVDDGAEVECCSELVAIAGGEEHGGVAVQAGEVVVAVAVEVAGDVVQAGGAHAEVLSGVAQNDGIQVRHVQARDADEQFPGIRNRERVGEDVVIKQPQQDWPAETGRGVSRSAGGGDEGLDILEDNAVASHVAGCRRVQNLSGKGAAGGDGDNVVFSIAVEISGTEVGQAVIDDRSAK